MCALFFLNFKQNLGAELLRCSPLTFPNRKRSDEYISLWNYNTFYKVISTIFFTTKTDLLAKHYKNKCSC